MPTQKIYWCLGLIIKNTIIENGHHELKLYFFFFFKKTFKLAFVYLIEKVFRHKKIWHIPMWQIINVRKKLTSIVSPNKNQYKLIILVFIVNIVNFYFDVTLFNFQQWTFRENCWLKSSVKVKQPKTNKALQPNRPHWLLHWLVPKLSYVSLN